MKANEDRCSYCGEILKDETAYSHKQAECIAGASKEEVEAIRQEVANEDKTVTLSYTAQVTELHPERPNDESESFRLMTFTDPDHGMAVWELFRMTYEVYEGGDAETGPQIGLNSLGWELVGGGIGIPKSIHDAISEYRYFEELQKEEADDKPTKVESIHPLNRKNM